MDYLFSYKKLIKNNPDLANDSKLNVLKNADLRYEETSVRISPEDYKVRLSVRFFAYFAEPVGLNTNLEKSSQALKIAANLAEHIKKSSAVTAVEFGHSRLGNKICPYVSFRFKMPISVGNDGWGPIMY